MRTEERLRQSRVNSISLVAATGEDFPVHARTIREVFESPTTEAWKPQLLEYVRGGIEFVVLFLVNAYVEFDLQEWLEFRRERQSAVTGVCDQHGGLPMVLLDARQTREKAISSKFSNSPELFPVTGYVKRLANACALRELARDALQGRCELQPQGDEVREGIWIARGARIDPRARLLSPAYVGSNTKLRADVLLTRSAAVERNCEIDFGTSIEDASVLPGTYLGVGLSVAHAVVAGRLFMQVDRQLEMQIDDPALLDIARQPLSTRMMNTARSFWRRSPQISSARSTRS
ncbi:MAG TPA: hypothetical protein VEG30_08100 [Terriglobales bacterium]|nr:hypothetical protein [Terriglobales bacterium]